jgi:hypothetical protein
MERLAALLATTVTGDQLPSFVTGKANQPRYLNRLPVIWRARTYARMTRQVFTDYPQQNDEATKQTF